MGGEESWGWTALDACVYGLVGALMLYILLQVRDKDGRTLPTAAVAAYL